VVKAASAFEDGKPTAVGFSGAALEGLEFQSSALLLAHAEEDVDPRQRGLKGPLAGREKTAAGKANGQANA
jgi:hypothetical protein